MRSREVDEALAQVERDIAQMTLHALNDGRAEAKDHERLWHDVNTAKLDVGFLKQRVAQLETSNMALRQMLLEHHEIVPVHDENQQPQGLRVVTKLDIYRGKDPQGHVIHEIRRHNKAETAYIVEPATGWVGDRE